MVILYSMLILTAVDPSNHKLWASLVFMRNYRMLGPIQSHTIQEGALRFFLSLKVKIIRIIPVMITHIKIIHMNSATSLASKKLFDSNPFILYSKLSSIVNDAWNHNLWASLVFIQKSSYAWAYLESCW